MCAPYLRTSLLNLAEKNSLIFILDKKSCLEDIKVLSTGYVNIFQTAVFILLDENTDLSFLIIYLYRH